MQKKEFVKMIQSGTKLPKEEAEKITNGIINNYAIKSVQELKNQTEDEEAFMAAVTIQMVLFNDFVTTNILVEDLADSFIKGYKDGKEIKE